METNKVSKKLLNRLPLYLNYLKSLPEDCENVSATGMARGLHLGEVQVRKDLAKVSDTGRRRTGRSRQQLILDIENYLDLTTDTGTILVGTGKLGQALLDYNGFLDAGMNLMAGFDRNPSADRTSGGKPIYPMSRLESFCRHYNVRIGIIAVPPESAQAICDCLVSCGIKAIWNFAPVPLKVPGDVVVHSENLAVSLSALRLQMREKLMQE
ncbi:MAG: redox-sensing transcriptional repressor Rex [Oscillospiraceae bacterium]|nr:redox-sensing transcriptional repressor Rex [Oscillospiraceae bacterium]